MARKKEQASEGAPEWMATYSDMVTLLLTFFIMLFAMSTVDKNTFEEVAKSLSQSFLNLNTGDSVLIHKSGSILTIDYTSLQNGVIKDSLKEKYLEDAEDMVVDAEKDLKEKVIDEAKNDIRDTIAEKGLSDKVQVVEEKDFLLIRLESEIFFQSGSAEINDEGKKVLSALANDLRGIENDILISGHTDNVPIHTVQYSSNWELSTARATNVVAYLVNVEKLDPAKLTATGNGEYRPIGDNSTPEGRQKNRRIEIKIMK
jgi:chemotaxis protein MotB